jgi:hypothetical protein
MKIGLLHTVQVHVATFDMLVAGRGVQTVHHLAPELLVRAQTHGVDHVRCDVKNAVAQLDQADVILCTCSTLGPVIDALDNPRVLRIDTPAFDCAVAAGGDILVVICLESTREASQTLLATRAHTAQVNITQHTIVCAAAWAHFTAGDMDLFDRAIATDVRRACAAHPYNTVVLAQASMANAAHLLADLGVPVFTTPQTAVDHALKIAQARA